MKKKPNWFLRFVLLSFLIFLATYIASVSGYKEKKLQNKVILTNTALKEFESDILAGKEVDVKNYLNNEYIDYSNNLTRAGDAITETIQTFITNGLTSVWNAIKVLFW